MGCRSNGLSELWAVGVMGCRSYGLSELWAVGVMGCRNNATLPNKTTSQTTPQSIHHPDTNTHTEGMQIYFFPWNRNTRVCVCGFFFLGGGGGGEPVDEMESVFTAILVA